MMIAQQQLLPRLESEQSGVCGWWAMAAVIYHPAHCTVLARDDHGRIRGEEPRGAEEESEGERGEVVSVGRGHCKRLRFAGSIVCVHFLFFMWLRCGCI